MGRPWKFVEKGKKEICKRTQKKTIRRIRKEGHKGMTADRVTYKQAASRMPVKPDWIKKGRRAGQTSSGTEVKFSAFQPASDERVLNRRLRRLRETPKDQARHAGNRLLMNFGKRLMTKKDQEEWDEYKLRRWSNKRGH